MRAEKVSAPKNVGQLCDVETTKSGSALGDILNVQMVNIIAAASLKQSPRKPRRVKRSQEMKNVFCSVAMSSFLSYCSIFYCSM